MIEIVGLQKNWGNFSLLDINLKIETGEFFGLFGHNGAGKTLLLETITGIWQADNGRILFNGKDITLLAPEERNIGFVYQEPWLFPHLSVKDNICYGLKVRRCKKIEIEKRIAEINEMLKLAGILKRRNTALLSGGEKQKVALARTLAIKPGIILLDEPTHSLDKESCEYFYQMLLQIRKGTKPTIIFVSHNYEELKKLANRIGVMEKGSLIHIDENIPYFQ